MSIQGSNLANFNQVVIFGPKEKSIFSLITDLAIQIFTLLDDLQTQNPERLYQLRSVCKNWNSFLRFDFLSKRNPELLLAQRILFLDSASPYKDLLHPIKTTSTESESFFRYGSFFGISNCTFNHEVFNNNVFIAVRYVIHPLNSHLETVHLIFKNTDFFKEKIPARELPTRTIKALAAYSPTNAKESIPDLIALCDQNNTTNAPAKVYYLRNGTRYAVGEFKESSVHVASFTKDCFLIAKDKIIEARTTDPSHLSKFPTIQTLTFNSTVTMIKTFEHEQILMVVSDKIYFYKMEKTEGIISFNLSQTIDHSDLQLNSSVPPNIDQSLMIENVLFFTSKNEDSLFLIGFNIFSKEKNHYSCDNCALINMRSYKNMIYLTTSTAAKKNTLLIFSIFKNHIQKLNTVQLNINGLKSLFIKSPFELYCFAESSILKLQLSKQKKSFFSFLKR